VKWLDKLERRFGNIGIKGLMLYIAGANAIVLLIGLSSAGFEIVQKLTLVPQLVLNGEVWRLITFAFIPPSVSPIFALFVLYFYYLIGTTLEKEWGVLKFNLYYFIGFIGTIIGTFIAGGAGDPTYLNLSLFLAFAYIFPDYQILLFFIIPIKMKYLAWLDTAFLVFAFFTGDLTVKLLIAVSMLNFMLFFGKDIVVHLRSGRRVHYNRKKYAAQMPKILYIHRCEICKRSEKDDKNLEFRYCVDCEGNHEYCMEHLKNHVHIKNG